MNKEQYRSTFKEWQKIIKFAPILEELGIPKTNFSQFINGKDTSLSVAKLSMILAAIKQHLKEIDGGVF